VNTEQEKYIDKTIEQLDKQLAERRAGQRREGDRRQEISSPAMSINTNQKCIVVLTECGVHALQKYYRDLDMEPPKDCKAGDEYVSELWQIMHIFGGFACMGSPPPFETTIKIEPFLERK
jgi:hypothetical protein